MKFKVVFILFNVVIVISFLVIYLMPLIMLGWDYTRTFWADNWGLPVLFVAILGGLNGYFAFNWKLFTLLEREDWEGLIGHLEHRIFEKHLILAQQCRILINAYLVRSRLESVEKLEAEIEKRKPGLLGRLVMPIGVRYLLSNDPKSMVEFFGKYKNLKGRDGGWALWSFAFSSLLADEREQAKNGLEELVAKERNPVLLMLSLYLLDSLAPGIHHEEAEKLRAKFASQRMADEVERQRNHVQVVILAKLITEASDWLYESNSDKAN